MKKFILLVPLIALLGLFSGSVVSSAPPDNFCIKNPNHWKCETSSTTTEPPPTTTTEPPLPTGEWPSSFFTGPLNANVPLPSNGPGQGAFLIEWYDGAGCDIACKKAGVQKRQTDAGVVFDSVGLHPNYGNASEGCTFRDPAETEFVSWVNANGSLPNLSWAPNVTITQVNQGVADACFRSVANHLEAYGFTVMLRVWPEFDLVIADSEFGQPFINAWRRMVGIFQAEGATNVGFWWTPTEGSRSPGGKTARDLIDSSYPGDAYIDWVGSDAYNFCFVSEINTCWSSPLGGGWAEFKDAALYRGAEWCCVNGYDRWAQRKPYVYGETNTVYDPNAPFHKGNWYRNLVTTVKANPFVIGVQIYDADVRQFEGERNNFRVDAPTSNPDVYAGYLDMARDPYFGG